MGQQVDYETRSYEALANVADLLSERAKTAA
jgi:hypothetical protein